MTRARCYAITGGPRAWLTDGDRYEEARVGEPPEAVPLAVTSDAQGVVYAISAEPPPGGLAITKYAAAGAGGKPDWQNLHKVAVELPAKTTARVTFAAISPANTLWVGLRAASADGGEVGIGALEIRARQRVRRATRPPEGARRGRPEALPLPASLHRHPVRQRRDVLRVAGRGQPLAGRPAAKLERKRRAGERARARAGAAGLTARLGRRLSEGLARFDGKDWRPLGDD